jgi:NADPH2:quinone reductase
VSKHFSLDEGPAAIRWMMDRKATGKVVLTV